MKNIIPTLDLVDFSSFIPTRGLIKSLRHTLEFTGFFFLKNHGLGEEKIKLMEKAHQEFFALPEHLRNLYHYPDSNGQMGYTHFRVETGEHFDRPDEKHFFHTFPGQVPYIKEVPYFKEASENMWTEFNTLSLKIMHAVSLSLGLAVNFFNTDEPGYSLLRGIHYPAQADPLQDEGSSTLGGNLGGMCASSHTDINMITLLLAREPGLQLFHQNTWIPVTIDEPDLIIVNCGDMLEHITNGVYRSGMHRVVCQKNTERFSYPFFFHVPGDFNIEPLEVFGRRKEKYSFTTALEFLNYRLEQINLKK